VSTRSPGARKATLAVHVVSSVGWLGAVATYLALAVLVVTAPSAVRVATLLESMRTLVWVVLLPAAALSFLSGLVSSWLSPWGLFRHYWVTVKFGVSLLCVAVLAMYTQDIQVAVDGASRLPAAGTVPAGLGDPSHAVHAAAALVVLTVTTALAVYKPKGQLPRESRRAEVA